MTTLEAMAKAHYEITHNRPTLRYYREWAALPDARRADLITAIRSVVHVMREPSEAVLRPTKPAEPVEVEFIWNVILDGILQEEPAT